MSPTATTQSDWLKDVRGAGVVAVAQAFGTMHLVRDDRPAQGMTPCPACGDDTRHHKRGDRRGAVGLTRDGLGWRCFQCEASGDAVTLACLAAGQGRDLTRDNARAVREACERVGLVSSAGAPAQKPRQAPAPAAPEYPPWAELVDLYAHQAVTLAEARDTDVDLWLVSRKLDKGTLAAADVVRALPRDATAPAWAVFGGKPWPGTPYRLLAPLWGADGEWLSVHARAVSKAEPKSTNPMGCAVGGLVLACPRAQGMLYGREADVAHVRRCGLVIAEGLPDWLTLVAQHHGNPDGMAVLGILSGSWRQAHADKVPDGCRVLVATDNDNDGDKYAAAVAKTLARRMRAGLLDVRRWKPREVQP